MPPVPATTQQQPHKGPLVSLVWLSSDNPQNHEGLQHSRIVVCTIKFGELCHAAVDNQYTRGIVYRDFFGFFSQTFGTEVQRDCVSLLHGLDLGDYADRIAE